MCVDNIKLYSCKTELVLCTLEHAIRLSAFWYVLQRCTLYLYIFVNNYMSIFVITNVICHTPWGPNVEINSDFSISQDPIVPAVYITCRLNGCCVGAHIFV